ncbi:MAG: hypothetical protein OEZ01_13295 [Candidatus Heimdallarchaeota archaeon]|nr:hypothetical protein [Candidatus Heimdallarchaeota archaeon]MDH5646983.1 hypothetical protein [Candidatus Heimdallarchaeota archaeon]
MVVTFNHVEIPVLDLNKAKEFYETIFNWTVDLESYPNYGFVMLENDFSLGFFKVEKIPEIGINVVFGIENIDDTLKNINDSGGKTHRDKYHIAPEVGYAAEFLDCFGNRLGLHSRN